MTRTFDISALTPVVGELDIRFAELMTTMDRDTPVAALFPAAALASRASRQGHVCFDLQCPDVVMAESDHQVSLPPVEQWQEMLSASRVVGRPGEFTPLILDGRSRLYLHRYWQYEHRVAAFIARHYRMMVEVDLPLLAEGVARIFPSTGQETNMQAVAAISALTRRFCVVSGGPGTGKTTTVAGILALLAEQAAAHPEFPKPEIALAAPTGKAAARLGESMTMARQRLDSSPSCLSALPGHAATIHRLLGSMRHTSHFRYNRHHKLPADVVVVDEASMVDLALMARLVDALHDTCRLILVGDRNQLTSVAAGSVFADICDAAGVNAFSGHFQRVLASAGIAIQVPGQGETVAKHRLYDTVVRLERNYRFDAASGISRISRAIRDGDLQAVMAVLADDTPGDVRWHRDYRALQASAITEDIIRWFASYMAVETDIAACFDRFDRFRVLCALREGPCGAGAMNRRIERIVRYHQGVAEGQVWYPGRPVMITRNDYQRWLFNGDVGLTLRDGDNRLRVFFQGPDGVRGFHPRRLPDHETAFAMTVHKSQGAEFNRVFVVMPDIDTPVLSRSLLYTAVTRAKSSIEIVSNPDILKRTIERDLLRLSGLREVLAGRSA